LEDYARLFWRRPVLASIFTLMLLSLAGIPVTAGFLAKFYVVPASASAGIWALILILVTTSTIGLFYYLRVVILLVWVGVYPVPLLNVIRTVLPM